MNSDRGKIVLTSMIFLSVGFLIVGICLAVMDHQKKIADCREAGYTWFVRRSGMGGVVFCSRLEDGELRYKPLKDIREEAR